MASPDTEDGFPNRNAWYYYAADGTNLMKIGVVSATRSGYPNVGVLPESMGFGNGAAMIGIHSGDQPSGLLTTALYHDAFEGLGAFSPHFDNMQDDFGETEQIIWPKIAVNPVDGGVTVAANGFINQSGPQYTSYLAPDSVTMGGNLYAWYNLTPDLEPFVGGPEWPSAGANEDGMVAIVANDIGGDMRIWESPSGDFSSGDWTMTNVTNFDNSLLDTVDFTGGGEVDTSKIDFRPWHTADFIYDLNGVPHIVWAEGLAAVDLATGDPALFAGITGYSLHYRIRHWDNVTGLSTVYKSQRGTQDTVLTPVNTLPTSLPTIGVSDDNTKLYVVFQEMRDEWRDDAPVDFGFGELFTVTATNGDTNWTAHEDVVNVSNEPLMDDRYPSVARINPGGKVHLFYVSDPEGNNAAFFQGEPAPLTYAYMMYNAFDPAGSGIEDDEPQSPPVPMVTGLAQNYPNPFNPQTTIRYTLNADSNVRLTIHNVRGEVVATLVSGNEKAGDHAVAWDGKNTNGARVSSGVYFYRLSLGDGQSMTRKMVLLK
jgi:hypothetical protein